MIILHKVSSFFNFFFNLVVKLKILRNKFNIWLYRKLPVDWAIPLAKFVAGSSREHTRLNGQSREWTRPVCRICSLASAASAPLRENEICTAIIIDRWHVKLRGDREIGYTLAKA